LRGGLISEALRYRGVSQVLRFASRPENDTRCLFRSLRARSSLRPNFEPRRFQRVCEKIGLARDAAAMLKRICNKWQRFSTTQTFFKLPLRAHANSKSSEFFLVKQAQQRSSHTLKPHGS
jgi:hypothetical protein